VCKKNILLIDDDDDELEIFTAALEDLKVSYNCSLARNAQQAMIMLDNSIPDLIFLDVNMPGKGGLKCLRDIRERDALKQVPVIIYTTCHDEHGGKNAMNSGAAAYVRKPSSIKCLTGILKQVLDHYSVLDPYPVFHVYE
jgi:DNA-binding NtrC family response regulator